MWGIPGNVGQIGADLRDDDLKRQLLKQQLELRMREFEAQQQQQAQELALRREEMGQRTQERADAQTFRTETRDRSDAADLAESLSPGEISPEQSSVLSKSPATRGRLMRIKPLQAKPLVEGMGSRDLGGPSEMDVLSPTPKQAESAFQKSEHRRLVEGLSPQLRQAQEAEEAGVSPTVAREMFRDRGQEMRDFAQEQDIRESTQAKYRPPQRETKPRIDIRSVPSRGPNGEPGTKLITLMDGIPIREQWEPGNPSAGERSGLADFETFDRAMSGVKESYKSELVGPAAGRYGTASQQLPGVPVPEGFDELVSKLAQVQNSLIYLRSGKQINESEFQRLKRELPLITDKPENFLTKLANTETYMETLLANRRAILGIKSAPDNTGPPSAAPKKKSWTLLPPG